MKVLLGIGGSDDSLHALEEVVERTKVTGDTLTVAILDNPESDRATATVERRVREVLDDGGVEANIQHLSGHPGSKLVELADSGEFDRVVLGGGQRSPMGKINLGSISEFVLLNSRTSVTLIR
ncbi:MULTISPECIES: universal stress protein [unclassified Haladaptatus]|uniref:universal stress protein n=1 Tax=unclassified Haladaptatus TaxID=2622732 RepID=UPI0023E8CF2C|nr:MULTISPECIES: universal stress protein [unclassified Haladaptatus]